MHHFTPGPQIQLIVTSSDPSKSIVHTQITSPKTRVTSFCPDTHELFWTTCPCSPTLFVKVLPVLVRTQGKHKNQPSPIPLDTGQ